MTTSEASKCVPLCAASARLRMTIDPVWSLINEAEYRAAWNTLITECRAVGFAGLDLEWSTVRREEEVVEAPERKDNDCREGEHSMPLPAEGQPLRKPRIRRKMGPVATVQLSSASVCFVFKFCDLHGLALSFPSPASPSVGVPDPLLPSARSWPHHRAGEKQNCPALLADIHANLLSFLEDRSVVKVGVGVIGDQCKLQRDYPGLCVHPCVDLVALAYHYFGEDLAPQSLLDADREGTSGGSRSLKGMCATYTGRVLDKDFLVITSDWGGRLGALSPLQQSYAAADAEASFDVCAGILSSAGVLTGDALDNRSAERGEDELICSCVSALKPLIGVEKGIKVRNSKQNLLQAPDDGEDEFSGKGNNRKRTNKGRDKPYYDNIQVYSPDMELLFTVDKSKAKWYVYKKNLATVIEWREAVEPEEEGADPRSRDDGDAADPGSDSGGSGAREMAAIRLSFKPDFERFNNSHIRRNMDYFRQAKENVCVVCGSGDKIVRFAVVPFMYRRHFPSVYMSHNSYDLLLLCTSCFARTQAVYEAERQRVAVDFGIPIKRLVGDGLEIYRARIAEREARLPEDCAAFAAASSVVSNVNTPPVAHLIHPQLIVNAMKEYCEIQQHRSMLVAVVKFAKALRGHYMSLAEAASPSEGDEVAQMCGAGEDDDRDDLKPSTVPSSDHHAARPKGINRRSRAAKKRELRLLVLPEERRAKLASFLEAHAHQYPFYRPEGPISTAEEQERIFAEYGPASPQGVDLIMGPIGAETSFRVVLARFWLREHPEVAQVLAPITRQEEREEVEGDDDGDGGSAEAPYVDANGFLVVKMLMEKYRALYYTPADPAFAKNSDHAVGQFIYRWRRAFVERMKPQHLPNGWSVDDGILM